MRLGLRNSGTRDARSDRSAEKPGRTPLYRHVRNPMYLGILLILGGEALFFSSRALSGYAALVFLLFAVFVVAYEEPALRRKFGEDYERYCDRVPRWIPRFHVDLERRSEGR